MLCFKSNLLWQWLIAIFRLGCRACIVCAGGVEGSGTYAVRAGAPHKVVQEAMRVKTNMVGYYATIKGEDLAKVS